MGFFLVPPNMRKNIGGHAGFQDRGQVGTGVPGYMSMRGYQGFEQPTAIGARYFPPEPDYDETSDQPTPIAAGYVSNGGRPAYRNRVYNAAKKKRKTFGFSREDMDDLSKKGYDEDWQAKPRSHR